VIVGQQHSNGLQIDSFGRGSEQSEGRIVIVPKFRGVNFTVVVRNCLSGSQEAWVEGDSVGNSGKTLPEFEIPRVRLSIGV